MNKDTVQILFIVGLCVWLTVMIGMWGRAADKVERLQKILAEKPSAAIEYRPTVLIKVPVECSIEPMWEIEQAKAK